MNKEEQQEELQEAFVAFAAKYPQSALSLIIGLFVGLLEYSVIEQGGDETMEIRIDGCGKRDIIVSATSHNATGQRVAEGESAAPTGCASNGNYNERTEK